MSEANAWSTVRSHLVNLRPLPHIQRLEDKLTGGIPDTNVCFDGIDFWLEGKYVDKLPKRDSTLVRVDLRADQALWHENRQLAGGKTFVWIRVNRLGWQLWDDRFRSLQDGVPLNAFLQEPIYKSAKEMVAEIVRRVQSWNVKRS